MVTSTSRSLGGDASGSALLSVLLLMFLFSAIAFGAVLVIRVEITISDRYRQAGQALYAADAGLAITGAELRALSSWTPVLSGLQPSALSEGAFTGPRNLPGGGSVILCCGAGSVSDRLATATRVSPLPARRAVQWRPFLWAPFGSLAPEDPALPVFLVVWVADDEEDGDGVATVDANGVVLVRAEAVGRGGLSRTVEAFVARRPDSAQPPESGFVAATPPAIGLLRWREVR